MRNKLIDKKNILLRLSVSQFFYFLSVGIIFPFLSLILKEANWSIQNITYFFSLSSFIVFFLSPIIGKISDKIGKKKIMVLGLSIQVIT